MGEACRGPVSPEGSATQRGRSGDKDITPALCYVYARECDRPVGRRPGNPYRSVGHVPGMSHVSRLSGSGQVGRCRGQKSSLKMKSFFLGGGRMFVSPPFPEILTPR